MASDNRLIFHLSDIHFGLEHTAALEWVREEIARRAPDAVAITGDLTMRARHREFAAAKDWINTLAAPVTVEVGNHDMPYFNPLERFIAPYRRFRGVENKVERELDLGSLAIVPLKTAVRAQPRLNWSKGWITGAALDKCLRAIDALPAGTRVLVAAHHPLREVGTKGTALTRNGEKALRELARRQVVGVLSGHVHDAFDILEETSAGPVRMIGAGTLSQRTRSTPPSFNEIAWQDGRIEVTVRNLEEIRTCDMQIDDVPENALPPREPDEPVAPVNRVPPVDPPVH